LIGTLVVVVLGLALDIGLAPVLQRFSFEDPLHDSRMLIYSRALEGIGKFLPLGSGPGTFPEAFRQFQPVELGNRFVNHAHNDYLEWLFEGGLAGAALGVLLLAAYLRQWLSLAAEGPRHSFRFVQFGAGIGLLLLLLHSLADFNWHIPANALYAAFLAGLFLARPGHSGRGATHGDSRHDTGLPESEAQRLFVLAKPAGPVRNPFDDRTPQ
jgi:O-antigen ligase